MPGAIKSDLERARAPESSHVLTAGAVPPKILCVDDEPAMLAILSRSLRSNFEIVTADDPVLALSMLERNSDFSVIISDLKMPQMDGAEFLARVKRLAPTSTRLALTACLERQLPPDEAFGILTKPCPLNLLHESVAAAVQHHFLLLGELRNAHPEGIPNLESGVRLGVDRQVSDAAAAAPSQDPAGRPGTRLCLRLFGKDTELRPGVTTLGRSKSCHIVVDDPRIGARHARFVCSFRGVTLQDVSGKGGVRLNGERFAGARYLQPGDWIGVGPFDAEVRPLRSDAVRAAAEAARHEADDWAADPLSADSGASGALEILSGVAEKFFRLGQFADAERILQVPLEDFLRRCEEGHRPTALDTEMAVALAVRLAEQGRGTRWADYTIRVFSSVGRSVPPSIVERLKPAAVSH